MCVGYMSCGVLGAHLVLSVLAALGMCWLYVVLRVHLCVGYMWCSEHTDVLAI